MNYGIKDTRPFAISLTPKGGYLKNIDGATGDSAVTSSGWIESETFGHYFAEVNTSGSAEFDTAIFRTGRCSVKLSTLDVTGTVQAVLGFNTAMSANVSAFDLSKYGIPIDETKEYSISVPARGYNLASSAGVMKVREFDSAGTLLATHSSNAATGTTDWVFLISNFTPTASAAYMVITYEIVVAGNISDCWFDTNALTINEILPTKSTFVNAEPVDINISMLASYTVDSIDQSRDESGAAANTYTTPTTITETATHRNTFTPTRRHITKFGFWVVSKGTGDLTVEIHDASNNIKATKTIVNASITNGAFNYFELPCIWTSGNYHAHIISTVADATIKVGTSNDLETATYASKFLKRTNGCNINMNGIITKLDAVGGLLPDCAIDFDRGYYKWFYQASTDSVFKALGAIESSSFSSQLLTVSGFEGKYTLGTSNIVFKISTIQPLRRLKVAAQLAGAGGGEIVTVAISTDNVVYTTVDSSIAGANSVIRVEDDKIVNGHSCVYVRFAQATGGFTYLQDIEITGKIDRLDSVGKIYPTTDINKFSHSIKSDRVFNRIYYSVFNGIKNDTLQPTIELANGSTVIERIPLEIQNYFGTTPAAIINIAETTNAQLSGTGTANFLNDYVLNSGEYMTLTSDVSEATITYRIGTGSSSAGFITDNYMQIDSSTNSDETATVPYSSLAITVFKSSSKKGKNKRKITRRIAVAAAASSATAAVPMGWRLLGLVPITQDKIVASVVVNGSTVTLTLASAATANNVFDLVFEEA